MIENNLEKILEVDISDAELSFDIATPHKASDAPFVAEYLEYKMYETVSSETVAVADIRNFPTKTYEIQSDIYLLAYMPNAIYVWVGPNAATMYGSNKRCTIPRNTYAQITDIEVDYGISQSSCTITMKEISIS